MSKLEKFSERIVSADVILKVDKDHEHGNKVATITLYMPGEDLVAEGRSRSFEEAVDIAVEGVRVQMVRQKEKYQEMH